MELKLAQILELVGSLDDGPGENTARARFRKYLQDSVKTTAAVRDYVQECLQTSGPQYSRALQDLLNHTGRLIGFAVEFGRYQGVTNEIGFDGLWKSTDLALVVEIKTTDVYAIKTSTLLNYINGLVSAQRISSPDNAVGLYVVGRLDPDLRQLENAITAERRTQQLRVITVDSILSLAELIQDGQISHEEALALIRPGAVLVDSAVQLLARVASGAATHEPAPTDIARAALGSAVAPDDRTERGSERLSLGQHIMTPLSDNEQGTIKETLDELLGKGWYVFGDRTPGRKSLAQGDRICFYATTIGVVAEAEVASKPELGPVPGVRYPERYPWKFRVRNVRDFYEKPIAIDAELRSRLDAFRGRDPAGSWGWFVQNTKSVTPHDFALLTGAAGPVEHDMTPRAS